MTQLISIAGMMGSGKTTLARNLANILTWNYLPRSRHATRFLPDLFQNQTRWAFDTQISFLIEKTLQVIQYSELSQNVVLDRSIQEDIFIFAAYFYESGAIDKRSFETYRTLAEYFVTKTPTPIAILYCKCELDTAVRRIKQRNTGIQFTYPPEHLTDIAKRYRSWRSSLADVPVIDIDSEAVDFRSMDVVRTLIDGPLADVYQQQVGAQLQIFSSPLSSQPGFAKSIRNRNVSTLNPETREASRLRSTPPTPVSTVYIAAPFTTAAATNPSGQSKIRTQLFEDNGVYGIIPKGPYRDALSKLANSFRRIGFSPLLPHRDVNKWGRRRIPAFIVFEQCSYHVAQSDLFVGVLGLSHGSHYEFGLALGLGKPCISITCQELDESFVASGIRTEGKVLHWRCSKLSDLPKLLDNVEAREFIYSNIGK